MAVMTTQANARPAWDEIRVILLDCDGVLSDGGLLYRDEGGESKRFHAHDGRAIKDAVAAGLRVGIVSGRYGSALARRADELGCNPQLLGVEDKVAAIEFWLAGVGLGWAQVAYVGDDLPDAGCLLRARVGVAVADAVPALRRQADHVTRLGGGRGAVAEFLDRLLRGRRPQGHRHG